MRFLANGDGTKRRVRTPTVLQMEMVECGAASLAMILAYYGRFVPLEETRIACGVTRDGSNARSVLVAARKFGLTAKGFRQNAEAALAGPLPAIVFWNYNHFLVLEGERGGKIWLNDPGAGRRWVSREEFDSAFTGVVLRFEKGPEFTTGGEPPRPMARLWNWLADNRLAYGFIALASLFLVVPAVLVPGFIGIMVDHYLIQDQHNWLQPLLMAMLLAMVCRCGLAAVRQAALRQMQLRLALTHSAQFLWHLLRLPLAFFQQRYVGDLSERATASDRAADLFAKHLSVGVLDLLTLPLFVVAMVLYSGSLAVAALLSAALIGAVVFVLHSRQSGLYARHQQNRLMLFAASVNGIQLIETLKATGGEDGFFSRWAGYHAKVANDEQEAALLGQLSAVIPDFMVALSAVLMTGLAALLVVHGELTLGGMAAFQILFLSFIGPVRQLAATIDGYGAFMTQLTQLDDVLAYRKDTAFAPVGSHETAHDPLDVSRKTARLAGRVTLENISFGYSPTEPPLIEDFSLDIKPGGRIALVGASGSGRSTIAKLVSGLLQPGNGAITFDGLPRGELPRDVISNSLSFVDQDVFLFEGSVYDNLTLWDSNVPRDVVTRAAIDAAIHDDIVVRPQSYDSIVTEGGRNFSGGEAQRMEIARALITDPSILVLDEATSALDPTTEQYIFDRLRQRGCSSIIVAHRLSTIRDCDEIIVLDKGKIIERGRHQELLEQGGAYAELIASE
ncbi:MAG: NHLP family bacteriocin export ABC transporter peptidase/permease/ATPase subunit [Hyphomicrobiaceae bacterium]